MKTSKNSTLTGVGCLYASAAPFCLVGFGTAIAAARGLMVENPDREQIELLALFAVVFGGAGSGMLAVMISGHRKLLRREELDSDSPWSGREDSVQGRVPCWSKTTVWTAWVFAFFWNLVSLSASFLVAGRLLETGSDLPPVALIFPIAGAGLLVWAVRITLRWRRAGAISLEGSERPDTLGVGGSQGIASTAESVVSRRKVEETHQTERSSIVVEARLDGKTAITYPACRNPGEAFTATAFLVILLGATALQAHLGTSLILLVLTGVLTSLLTLVVVELWLGTTRVIFDAAEVHVTSGILRGGKTRTFRAENIEQIETRPGMRSRRSVY